jgi:heterodisulfide reductase subunit A
MKVTSCRTQEKKTLSRSSDKVLVVGGGMGGIRTALDLAESGRGVILVDTAPSIGGLMTRLDRTFPTNNCDLCTLSPNLSESGRSARIRLMTLTEVSALAGDAGDFTVTLTTRPRYIDLQACTACGVCRTRFPECVTFSPGLDHRAPTCMRYPQATPQAYAIDMARCNDVAGLVAACPAGAIVPEDTERVLQVNVGALVLATGAKVYDPAGLDHFGYGRLPDVVTSLEYERILSASGPTGGRLQRPSDGRVPAKIAWIQCVGSRGLQKGAASYCSGACCMFSLKEAMVTKEHYRDGIEAAIFFMDMRTSGKDYELYYQRARQEYGVRFIRCRPHSIVQKPGGDRLDIQYVTDDAGETITETFDMAVLATGFESSPSVQRLASRLGIRINSHGFAATSAFDPVATSRPGIYACGTVEEPKDIPDTMVQASAAANRAACHAPCDDPGRAAENLPPERDVAAAAPRIGVFVCDCGPNIGGVVDVEAVVRHAGSLHQVVVAEAVGHGCSRDAMARIEASIAANNLNRIVIGGCSPRTHERQFQDLLRRSGLNRYLLEIANLRDQDTWVHGEHPGEAAAKARRLIEMAVSAVRFARPLSDTTLPMNQDVLVVGGGVTGMNAALSLADQGVKVVLVERSSQLGGLARRLHRTLEGDDVQAYLTALIQRTEAHPNIQLLTDAIIVDHSGRPGLFKTGMQVGPGLFYRQIEHGATVVATGAEPHRPAAFLLDEHPAVHTQLDLDGLLARDPDRASAWHNVVMIQCVGSRTDAHPNCDRICCQSAIKNALRIVALNPRARVFVLYRDIRTSGFQEDHYQLARQKGVIFVRYDPARPPLTTASGSQVTVRFRDPVIDRELAVEADCVALSTGFRIDEESVEDLAMVFHLPLTADHHYLEDHVKLRPVDLPVPGFFAAGAAHSPGPCASASPKPRPRPRGPRRCWRGARSTWVQPWPGWTRRGAQPV